MHENITRADENFFSLVKLQLPQWEEPVLHTRARYEQIVKDLADKYPTENLLLVTHGMIFNFLSIQL